MSPISYTLQYTIDDADLQALTESGYNLCFTKSLKFNGKHTPGNVVAFSVPASQLLPSGEFIWTDTYKTGETKSTFAPGASFTISTPLVAADGGQTVIFNTMGDPTVTGTPTHGKPFKVENKWQNFGNIVVQLQVEGDFASVWVSPGTLIDSTNTIESNSTVGVFFDSSLCAGSMFNQTQTPIFEVNMDAPVLQISFKNGTWALA